MKQLPFKLSLLVFFIALLSGFYSELGLMENLIRAFVIYLVFSVIVLLVMLVHTQIQYSVLTSRQQRKPAEQEAHSMAMENSLNQQ
ncbi:MAG: hypothetical protein D6715_10810 [Calditrichaeota bacterium]|nr:MAG: hypothetical protein D6715_10810 [Calditrichota bacterium]